MKQREIKQIHCMLELYMMSLQQEEVRDTHNKGLFKLFSKDDLVSICLWLYSQKSWKREDLEIKSEAQLIELIGTHANCVLWMIFELENRMNSFPRYTQEEVHNFLNKTQNENHYLMMKPVEQWDEYDKSNYRSILLRTGKAKRVFGIFNADVLEEDVYAVTTKPSYFFDTKEEAKNEITNIVAEGQFCEDELVIHSLWLLT